MEKLPNNLKLMENPAYGSHFVTVWFKILQHLPTVHPILSSTCKNYISENVKFGFCYFVKLLNVQLIVEFGKVFVILVITWL